MLDCLCSTLLNLFTLKFEFLDRSTIINFILTKKPYTKNDRYISKIPIWYNTKSHINMRPMILWRYWMHKIWFILIKCSSNRDSVDANGTAKLKFDRVTITTLCSETNVQQIKLNPEKKSAALSFWRNEWKNRFTMIQWMNAQLK